MFEKARAEVRIFVGMQVKVLESARSGDHLGGLHNIERERTQKKLLKCIKRN